jgi:hypothetical protein
LTLLLNREKNNSWNVLLQNQVLDFFMLSLFGASLVLAPWRLLGYMITFIRRVACADEREEEPPLMRHEMRKIAWLSCVLSMGDWLIGFFFLLACVCVVRVPIIVAAMFTNHEVNRVTLEQEARDKSGWVRVFRIMGVNPRLRGYILVQAMLSPLYLISLILGFLSWLSPIRLIEMLLGTERVMFQMHLVPAAQEPWPGDYWVGMELRLEILLRWWWSRFVFAVKE